MIKMLLAGIMLAAPVAGLAEWETKVLKDPMGGGVKAYAISDWTRPVSRVHGVYSDLRAVIGVGCEKGNQWTYVRFTAPANATKQRIGNGINYIKMRVKWDDGEPERFEGRQEWGSRTVNMYDRHIQQIAGSSTALVEIPWYSLGDVLFRFDLTGSAERINEAMAACGR